MVSIITTAKEEVSTFVDVATVSASSVTTMSFPKLETTNTSIKVLAFETSTASLISTVVSPTTVNISPTSPLPTTVILMTTPATVLVGTFQQIINSTLTRATVPTASKSSLITSIRTPEDLTRPVTSRRISTLAAIIPTTISNTPSISSLSTTTTRTTEKFSETTIAPDSIATKSTVIPAKSATVLNRTSAAESATISPSATEANPSEIASTNSSTLTNAVTGKVIAVFGSPTISIFSVTRSSFSRLEITDASIALLVSQITTATSVGIEVSSTVVINAPLKATTVTPITTLAPALTTTPQGTANSPINTESVLTASTSSLTTTRTSSMHVTGSVISEKITTFAAAKLIPTTSKTTSMSLSLGIITKVSTTAAQTTTATNETVTKAIPIPLPFSTASKISPTGKLTAISPSVTRITASKNAVTNLVSIITAAKEEVSTFVDVATVSTSSVTTTSFPKLETINTSIKVLAFETSTASLISTVVSPTTVNISPTSPLPTTVILMTTPATVLVGTFQQIINSTLTRATVPTASKSSLITSIRTPEDLTRPVTSRRISTLAAIIPTTISNTPSISSLSRTTTRTTKNFSENTIAPDTIATKSIVIQTTSATTLKRTSAAESATVSPSATEANPSEIAARNASNTANAATEKVISVFGSSAILIFSVRRSSFPRPEITDTSVTLLVSQITTATSVSIVISSTAAIDAATVPLKATTTTPIATLASAIAAIPQDSIKSTINVESVLTASTTSRTSSVDMKRSALSAKITTLIVKAFSTTSRTSISSLSAITTGVPTIASHTTTATGSKVSKSFLIPILSSKTLKLSPTGKSTRLSPSTVVITKTTTAIINLGTITTTSKKEVTAVADSYTVSTSSGTRNSFPGLEITNNSINVLVSKTSAIPRITTTVSPTTVISLTRFLLPKGITTLFATLIRSTSSNTSISLLSAPSTSVTKIAAETTIALNQTVLKPTITAESSFTVLKLSTTAESTATTPSTTIVTPSTTVATNSNTITNTITEEVTAVFDLSTSSKFSITRTSLPRLQVTDILITIPALQTTTAAPVRAVVSSSSAIDAPTPSLQTIFSTPITTLAPALTTTPRRILDSKINTESVLAASISILTISKTSSVQRTHSAMSLKFTTSVAKAMPTTSKSTSKSSLSAVTTGVASVAATIRNSYSSNSN